MSDMCIGIRNPSITASLRIRSDKGGNGMKKRKIAMVAALCLSMMLLFSACGNASTAALGYDESTGATTEEAAGSAYTGGEILNARSA